MIPGWELRSCALWSNGAHEPQSPSPHALDPTPEKPLHEASRESPSAETKTQYSQKKLFKNTVRCIQKSASVSWYEMLGVGIHAEVVDG